MRWWQRFSGSRTVDARAEQVLDAVGLSARRHALAGTLSYAEQRALDLGIALAGGAHTLLLDEPTAGMNRAEAARAIELIRETTAGRTLLMVEHDMDAVFSIADRISVLVQGRVIATGTPAAIRADAAVRAAYLGDGFETAWAAAWQTPASHSRRTAHERLARHPRTERVVRREPGPARCHVADRAWRSRWRWSGATAPAARHSRTRSWASCAAKANCVSRATRWQGLRTFEIARLGLGYVPEHRDVFPTLSVHENLQLGVAPRTARPRATLHLRRRLRAFPRPAPSASAPAPARCRAASSRC